MLNSHLSALFSTTLMLQATISVSLSFMLFSFIVILLAPFQINFMTHVLNICCCISSCLLFTLSSCIYLCSLFV